MDVKIDADAMSMVVSKAILEGISAEQKEALLEQAVTALITPVQRDRYSTTPAKTPLQEAFEDAARRAVQTVAYEMVEANTAFNARVREMVGEAIATAAVDDYDLKSRVTTAVAGALVDWKNRT